MGEYLRWYPLVHDGMIPFQMLEAETKTSVVVRKGCSAYEVGNCRVR
jgi:hypothetical protein